MTKKAKIEAALFVSETPLNIQKLSKFVDGDEDEAKRIVTQIVEEYKSDDRGFELVETPEGFEFRIKQQYRDNVADLAPFSDLSEGMLRTLAIIAAKQPIKQSTLVHYQGNKVYAYIKRLEAKGLIKAEKYGRTKLVTTTPGFEKYFGKSVEDVKRMLTTKLTPDEKAADDEMTEFDERPDEE